MIKKIFCLALVLIGQITMTSAQNEAFLGGSVGDHLIIKPKTLFFIPGGSKEITGSPYDRDSFELGMIHTVKGVLKDIAMRYDLFNDWIEYRSNGQIFILDPTPKILKIQWTDRTVMNTLYESQGRFKMGFFNVIDSAKVILFSKPSARFEKGVEAKPYEHEGIPAKFTRGKDAYYIKLLQSEAKLVTSIKKMIELFPDHQDKLSTYVSKNKINMNEPDLLRLWKYYKTL